LHRFPGAVGVESGSGGRVTERYLGHGAVLLQACTAVSGLRRRRSGL